MLSGSPTNCFLSPDGSPETETIFSPRTTLTRPVRASHDSWIRLLLLTLLCLGGGLVALGVLSPLNASAQPDSTRRAILEERGLPPDHSPRKALWRALAVPGWGQWYNRQYYKIPFVYGGLGGITVALINTNRQYLRFRHAALFKLSQERGNNEYPQFEDEYESIRDEVGGEVSSDVLRRERDRYRRLRDLSVIGLGLYYGLTVLDAYVSAHLLTFDVGEDLSMQIYPTPDGVSATLRIGL